LGHVTLSWDAELHGKVGTEFCGNDLPCPTLGYLRHLGYKFSPYQDASVLPGLPVTANPEMTGPVGGFGWHLTLTAGAPRDLNLTKVEQSPNSTLLFSVAYPPGTNVTVTATAGGCSPKAGAYTCEEVFHPVDSVAAVRAGSGNAYHMSPEGVATIRIVQFPKWYTGNPSWSLPTYGTPDRKDPAGFAVPKFERGGVLLPNAAGLNRVRIRADCEGTGPYCSAPAPAHDPDVCPPGLVQTAYDACCSPSDPSECAYADGSASPPSGGAGRRRRRRRRRLLQSAAGDRHLRRGTRV
jgi:hypothetical protein